MTRDLNLSYAQNLEDHHLWLAFAGAPRGTYIDVGAGHPIADNVTLWLYERGWSGVVVEPQEELLALYERLRPRDIRVGALLGEQAGETEFFRIDRLHGLSTTSRTNAEATSRFGAQVVSERRKVTTLAALCAAHALDEIDVLKIDVEGGEADVLRGNDWTRFRPKVVVVEAIAPISNAPTHETFEPYLLAQGYRMRLDDTLNRFYVAEERPEIMARLPSERAPWHAVRHMYEIGRADENPTHPDHALARALLRGCLASLPWLEPDTLAALLARGLREGTPLPDLRTQEFRLALGRIACGYDGGQIIAEDGEAAPTPPAPRADPSTAPDPSGDAPTTR